MTGQVDKITYCEVQLTEDKYQAFVYAVKNHYWYQMYIDDLPIWGETRVGPPLTYDVFQQATNRLIMMFDYRLIIKTVRRFIFFFNVLLQPKSKIKNL